MTCKDGRFNTGNPICSNKPQDLHDNAMIIDAFTNSDADFVEDRFGVERKTISGIEKQANDAIDGFEQLIDDKIIAQGGVEIANEWGDSPDKVLSQEFLSSFNERNIPFIEDFGGVADYDPRTGAGTDNTPAFEAAFEVSKHVRLKEGMYMVSGKGVTVPPYGSIIGAGGNAYSAFAPNSDGEIMGSYIIPRNLDAHWYTNAMITKCELSGGVLPNPNAGDSYTLSSEGRLDSYELVDLTNQNASGTTPATPRKMSYAVKLQRGSVLRGVVVRTTRKGGSLNPVRWELDFGEAPDIGVLVENGFYAGIVNCNISWAFKDYAVLSIQHEAGDGFYPQGDRFYMQNSFVEGHTCLGVRGADRLKVSYVSSTEVGVKWFKSHMFKPQGVLVINGKDVNYTSTRVIDGTLMFKVSDSSGVKVGTTLVRGEDKRDYGTGGTNFDNCFFRSISHPKLSLSTSNEYTDPFPYSGKLFEIAGNVVRGIHFSESCYFHGREDVAGWVHSASDIYINGYHEAKFVWEGDASSRFIALSLDELHSRGFTEATRGAGHVQFLNWSQTEASTDRSPLFRTSSKVGRFGGVDGLFNPSHAVAKDYALGNASDNKGAVVVKAPSNDNVEGYKVQVRKSNDTTVVGVDADGRVYLSNGLDNLDTSSYRNGRLHVFNYGGQTLNVVNTANSSNTRIRFENTASNGGIGVDGEGVNVFVNEIGSVYFGVAGIYPSSRRPNYNLGLKSRPFRDLYLQNQPTVTSDANAKFDIEDIDEKYIRVMSRLKFKQFKLKADTSGITHFGIIAQDWIKACVEVGVDPKESGVLIGDDKTGYSIRYTELMVLHNAYLEWRIEQLGGSNE